MKKAIIASAITVLFSTMATANSGLADRINEARSYPNKITNTKGAEIMRTNNKKVTDIYNQTREEAQSRRARQKSLSCVHS